MCWTTQFHLEVQALANMLNCCAPKYS